eukprot:gene4366-5372_t
MVRAKELETMSIMNSILAIVSVLFAAVNIIGCILNSYDNDCKPTEDNNCSPATTPQTFHNLEFWSTFFFNVVVLLAFNYSPKVLSNQYENPTRLKLIVLLSVGMSFMSCMLVSINLEKFEILSHELEYANELSMTMCDLVILLSLLRGRHPQGQSPAYFSDMKDTWKAFLSLFLGGLVSCAQLGVYNLSGWTSDGDSKGEQIAHYMEFLFNVMSSIIIFWFTMDNRFCAEKRMQQLMYSA